MDKRKDKKKNGGGAPQARIADERFASFQTDPRFRLPSRKHTKTTVDKRFASMLKDNDFTATAKVDKYGRKIKSDSKKKALQRLYQLEDEEEKDEDEEDEADELKKDVKGDDDEESEEEDEEDDIEVEDDEVVQRELNAARPRRFDPAREGGFSSSEDSDSDEDSEEEGFDLATGGDMQRLEREEIETGEVTKRIAIVNLDWDHVKSTDLMALFSSFIPANDSGKILNISIYPSEFGKERMQQEEIEGPPKQLFKKGKKDEESDDESASDSEAEEAAIKKKLIQEGDDQDFDSDALRAYQLDRLRYYYAVMTCSSKSTAQAIYEATDGTEYQASSNFIDLRFVPDDVTFDDEPRDQCEKIPESYKPIEFVTNALQSSKVKLTWDMHPEEINRKESIKRAFKGSRAEIDEQDLKAYLAGDSDSEEDDDDADAADGAADGEPKLTKKELARQKMREALGLAAEPESKKSKDAPVGEMEVTFTPALSGDKPKKDDREETTIEKYARKERERKEKKRQAAKAKREALNEDEDEDEDVQVVHGGREDDGEDLGFDDPFFTTEDPAPMSKTSIRKEERRKKREAREAAEARDVEEKAHLSKVMAEDAKDNQVDHLDHFDMNEIMRAEKQKSKKKKYQKKGKGEVGLQEDFKMDVKDDRFKAVFDSHEFAIDPSNPKYKATEGMKKLLEEGRKKRKMAVGGDEEDRPSGKKSKKGRR
ncbi:pre-rrna processing esf1 [Trichoderma arundinaceum]|uniref:Pre-rrna processing esf1 n=1 Tax=Trichoderma arundinaceum TaxID=490622 RepID=A0A395NMN9_TRIAR|nr:pre-rrna processing esf1 [Trichoderma arundinaceum]